VNNAVLLFFGCLVTGLLGFQLGGGHASAALTHVVLVAAVLVVAGVVGFGAWVTSGPRRASNVLAENSRAFVSKHTGWSILVSSVTGVALMLSAMALWRGSFAGTADACKELRLSQPWTLWTALAAAPSALLTWFWRTDHKKKDIDLAQSQELTSRFIAAVELLKKDAAGAIYALERVARDAPQDHPAVVGTLAAYIRACPRMRSGNRFVSQQAAVTAIGRRDVANDGKFYVDLTKAELASIEFFGDYEDAVFRLAQLQNAHFAGTKLKKAMFARANLQHSLFFRADVRNADFRGADLRGAEFAEVNAVGARLDGSTIIQQDGIDGLTEGGLKISDELRAELASLLRREENGESEDDQNVT
jgi:uncharacterized protein YjbI with pentapeptide repeats